MNKLPEKIRHYRVVEELVRETSQDLPNEAMEKKSLSIVFLKDYADPKPAKARLINSAHGKISELLLNIPSYVLKGNNNPLWKTYIDLLQKLPLYTRFLITTHDSCLEELKNRLSNKGLLERARLLPVSDRIKFTIWAQDAFVVVEDKASNEKVLVEPHSFLRENDAHLANVLSKHIDVHDTQAPLYFEGGNILCGDDFFLIGADYPIKSLKHLTELINTNEQESKADAIGRLFREYMDQEKRLIYVGSTLPVPFNAVKKFEKDGEEWEEHIYVKNNAGTIQPLFHIDMFITLAGRNKEGKYQLLVGDPKLAAEILRKELSNYAMETIFDNVADNMQKAGFEVVRNPLPITYVEDPEHKERKWYFASSNNALVEIIDDQKKRVWLPTYGHGSWMELQKTDEANKKIWEDLGFEVNMLEDFHPFAENSGAVHCIIKYFSRE